jgi:hypothetical protein
MLRRAALLKRAGRRNELTGRAMDTMNQPLSSIPRGMFTEQQGWTAAQ